MKLNKKAFFKGVKALSLIIVLLFTFLFSLGIRGNKAPLMANKQTRINLSVPNSGYVENIYFNTELTTDDINSIMSDLTFVMTPFLDYPVYPLLGTETGGFFVFIVKKDADEYAPFVRYEINYTTDLVNQEFGRILDYMYSPFTYYWYTSNLIINKNVVSSFQGLPVGSQNNLLTSLVSIENFSNSGGSSGDYQEGYDDGYQNGYEFGLLTGQQNGEEIGYQNGYIDGQRYGEQLGYNIGYEDGEEIGYQNGYNDGRLEESPIGLEWFKAAISVVNSFLDIQLLPNVTIGAILSGFVILVLLKWILAWFRG